MSVHWQVHAAAEFARLQPAWDRLNASGANLPFMHSAFIGPLLRHVGTGRERVAIATGPGNEPVAAAVLNQTGVGQWCTFQPSQLPLGACMVKPGFDTEALGRSLLKALPGAPMGLGLTQLDPLFVTRPADGPRVKSLDYIDTAWVDVAGSFDTYWEARGKNLRTNMRKQRSKLEADGTALHFSAMTDAQEMADAVAAYGRLEAAGWKADTGTAVDPATAQGRFYAEMLENFCAMGAGQVWQLKFGDRVVAMDLCIQQGGTLVILKTAYDPEYRTVSPAFLLKLEAFRRIFDAGQVQRIEFYGRRMEWHERWTENVRTLHHTNIYRWALVPFMHRQIKGLLGRGVSPAPTPVPTAAAASAAPDAP
jgi:hypothetical protein